MKKSLKKGFTLVELVIVIAVIAILSAVLIPTFGNVIQNSKDTAAYQNAKGAVDTYLVDQAENENDANLGDGWVLVFTGKVAYTDNKTLAEADMKGVYVFEYKDGALIQKQGKEVLKGKIPSEKTFKMSGITVGSDGKSWTATNATSLPLKYSFTGAGTTESPYKVTATVWWFKG